MPWQFFDFRRSFYCMLVIFGRFLVVPCLGWVSGSGGSEQEEISRTQGFDLNVHVYNNLVQVLWLTKRPVAALASPLLPKPHTRFRHGPIYWGQHKSDKRRLFPKDIPLFIIFAIGKISRRAGSKLPAARHSSYADWNTQRTAVQ